MKVLTTIWILTGSLFSFSQTFTEVIKAVAADRESEDRLGYSVSIDGDYAIVGAYGDDFGSFDPNMGSAYIFEKTGFEDWVFVQKITNSDQDDYDRFGYSVSIQGSIVVVGAYGEDDDDVDSSPLTKAGSAYIFERGDDGVWLEMQKLVASDRAENDEFGWSVDVFDSTVIIGAHHQGYDESGMDFEYHAGAVYIFDKDVSGVWNETQKIVPIDRNDDIVYPDGRADPTDEDLSDLFGGSVAIWGDYLIAGAHNHDYGPGSSAAIWNSGAAFIFERSGGVWTEVNKIQGTIRHAWDRFGYAVDIDSSIIIVGVYSEDESEFEGASLMNAGGAYIFERNGAGDWLQIQKLDASDRTTGDHFGRDVAIDDNFIVIGAEQEDLDADSDNALSNAGGAYIFEKDGGGVWSEIEKIEQSDRRSEDYFGESVAISEHTIFVGAWQHDSNEMGLDSTEDAGAAFFYSSIRCVEAFYAYDIDICAGDSIVVGGNVYNVTGSYIDTLLNIDACDSIVTTNLNVIEPIYFSQDISICSGTTYSIGDSIYDMTGTYENTLEAATGCDSVVTTNLTIEIAVTHTQFIYLCYTDSFAIGSSVYYETGVYEDSLITDEGCDSVVTTDLFIEDENTFTQELTLCFGDSLAVGDTVYFEAGVFVDTLESATFCDSVVYTTLSYYDEIDVSISFVDVITLTCGDPDNVTATYQWVECTLSEYVSIDGATDRVFIADINGNYAAIITDNDCSDTTECMAIIGVGIVDYTFSDFKVFPNPSAGQFIIETGELTETGVQIRVYNSVGGLIYEGILTEKKTMVNLEAVAKGMYILHLSNGEKTIIEKITIH